MVFIYHNKALSSLLGIAWQKSETYCQHTSRNSWKQYVQMPQTFSYVQVNEYSLLPSRLQCSGNCHFIGVRFIILRGDHPLSYLIRSHRHLYRSKSHSISFYPCASSPLHGSAPVTLNCMPFLLSPTTSCKACLLSTSTHALDMSELFQNFLIHSIFHNLNLFYWPFCKAGLFHILFRITTVCKKSVLLTGDRCWLNLIRAILLYYGYFNI